MNRNVLRKFVNLIALIILALGLYNIIQWKVGTGIGFIVYFFALLTPRYLYQNLDIVRKQFNHGVLSTVEILLTTVIILSTVGYIWLFHSTTFYNYDTYVHFIIILLLTLLFAVVSAIFLRLYKKTVTRGKFILVCMAFSVSAVFFWEFFELSVSAILKVEFFGQPGQPLDTLYDIMAGLLTIPLSSVLIYKYLDSYMKRWHKFKDFMEDFNK